MKTKRYTLPLVAGPSRNAYVSVVGARLNLAMGTLLVLGFTFVPSVFAERGRDEAEYRGNDNRGYSESRRVESPGVGAPGAGYYGHYDGVHHDEGVQVTHTGPGVSAVNQMESGAAAAGAHEAGNREAGGPGAGVAPGVGVGSPRAGALPRGYVSTLPAGWKRVYYNGSYCAYAYGAYYRPIYYQGSIVYVTMPAETTTTNATNTPPSP